MRPEGPEPPGDQREPTAPTGSAGPAARGVQDIDRLRRARLTKVLIALGIVVILLIFITSNSQGVKVHFVFFTRRPPLIWVMFACAVLGGIVGYLIGKPGKQITLRRPKRNDGSRGSSD